MKVQKVLQFCALTLFSSLSLVGCGGGGGGGGSSDEFVGAADTQIEASPSEIDTGDRTQVTIEVSQVHENGIVLKVRYPKGLSYVPGSALLVVDDENLDIGPQKNVTKDNNTYLVFFLTAGQFGEQGEGKVVFQLTGNAAVSDGVIEVDADVNDPLVNDDNEFSPSKPEFGAESSTDIAVI